MLKVCLTIAVLGMLIPGAASSQDQKPALVPSAPGGTAPTWQRTLRLSDGRTFVTDGGLAMDAALARPAALPATVLPEGSARFIERHLAAPPPDECTLSQLSARPDGRAYRTPTGVDLNQTYVDFFRRALPSAQVRLRTSGAHEPVVILVAGKPVGVFMPVAQ